MTNRPLSVKKPRYSQRSTTADRKKRHFWTPQEIISEIQLRENNGLPRERKAVLQENASLVIAADNHFRSWRKATIAAGLKPVSSRGGKQKWTKELVIAEIKKRTMEELSPSTAVNLGAYQAVYRLRLFDNWAKALEAAGFQHQQVLSGKRKVKLYPTTTNVISEIRRLSWGTELNPGSASDPDSFQSRYRTLYRTAREYFGSWAKAVTRAGLDYSRYEKHGPARSIIRVTLPPGWISLDEPVKSDSRTPRSHFFGADDAGYARAEDQLVLRTLFRQNGLAPEATKLLERVLDGEDLDDGEYELLASMVRAKPELVQLLQAA